MKFNKKIIALLLTLSIVFSVVIPISLTSAADYPTLDEATGDVLAYVNFSTGVRTNVTGEYGATNGDGFVTFAGTPATDVNQNVNAIVFNSSILANVKDSTLTIEMVIRPHTFSNHTVLLSIGDRNDFYAVTGMGDRTNSYKFNGLITAENVVKLNEWTILKYVITENGTSIYADGTQIGTSAEQFVDLTKLACSNEPIKFGQRTVSEFGDPSFDGDVSEIRITTTGNPIKKELDFNLGAVNLLPTNNTAANNSDTTQLSSSSVLTVQYTDATLGDNLEMYAKLTDTKGTETKDDDDVLVEKEAVGNSFLRVQSIPVHGANHEITNTSTAGKTAAQDIYSNTAGAVNFKFINLGNKSLTISDNLKVTVWIENTSTGESTNKATTTINNGFIKSGTPEADDFGPTNWMSYIDGSTLLSQINLPGTHDSGALYFRNDNNLQPIGGPYTPKNADGTEGEKVYLRYNQSITTYEYREASGCDDAGWYETTVTPFEGNALSTPAVTNYSTANQYNVCQDKNIKEQLEMGVRYLDIRCDTTDADANGKASTTINGVSVSDFAISHSIFEAYVDSSLQELLTFSQVYKWCQKFLEDNPSETIVIALNDEKLAGSDRGNLVARVQSFVKADPDLFYTKGNEIPTLDDVRGKIVLLRRMPLNDEHTTYFNDDNDFMEFYWIDGKEYTSSYSDPHSITAMSNRSVGVTTYFVQDNYGVYGTNKWNAVTKFADQASSSKLANQYYLNYFSASSLSSTPKSTADTVKSNFRDKYTWNQGTQYGYLVFDFIEPDICEKVYKTNIFTTEPQVVKDKTTDKVVNNESSNDKVVHYDFTDVENNTLDDLEDNGFDGTLVNTEYLEVNSIYDIITFNNTNNNIKKAAGYVSIPSSVFRGTGNTATIQMWMKDNSKSFTTLFSIGQVSLNENYFAYITKDPGDKGSVRYEFNRPNFGTTNSNNSDKAHSVETWHLVTYVLNGESVNVYVDEDLVIENAKANANFSDVNGGIFNVTRTLLGGTSVHNDRGFIGSMGDFTIYNYAVDDQNVKDTYATLAKEYTYILEASLGTSVAVAREKGEAISYIDEQYEDKGSTIYLPVSPDDDLTKAELNLKYDGSKVEISNDGGSTYIEYSKGTPVDLSGNVVLKVTSLADNREKWYDVEFIKEEDADLAVHYDFENIGEDGVVKDVSGNGFDGSLADGATANGTAVSLNGDKAHVSVDSQAIVNTGESFTITMFLKPERIQDTNTIVSYGNDPYNRLVILTFRGDSIGPRFNISTQGFNEVGMDSGKDRKDTCQRLLLNQWVQVTFTQENGTLKLYMNNELIDEVEGLTVAPSQIGNADFWLGAANVYGADGGFKGEIGDFRIYSTALTEDEIYDLYRENYVENGITLDASKVELESFYDWNKDEITSLKTEYDETSVSGVLAGTLNGATYLYKNVDFDTDGKNQATISFEGGTDKVAEDAIVKIYVDSVEEYNLVGTVSLNATGEGWNVFKTETATLNRLITGIHDVYYVLEGTTVSGTTYVGNHDYVQFTKDDSNKAKVVVNDYETGAFITEYYDNIANLKAIHDDNYIHVGWYNAKGGSQKVDSANLGEIVYLHRIKIDAPVHTGAGVRFEDKEAGITSGLRFKASISREEFYAYFMNGKDVNYVYDTFADNFTFGMLLIPKQLLKNEADLTTTNATALNVEGKKVYDQKNKEDDLEYTAVLTGMPESFYGVELVARAYIIYTDENGESATVYTDAVDIESYMSVVLKAYKAHMAADSDEYKLTDTQLAYVEQILGIG